MFFFAYSFGKACLSMRSAVEKMTMPRTKMINESAFEYYHRLRNIKRFIEEHYTEDIPLKKAARVAGLEKKYFSTFFHRKVGVGFKHWLTRVRVARAMDLIRAEDYSISEVAYAAGFKDMRTFERAFKKCTSRTPRDFKNRVRPS
jgi:AraC-like DNA-binding protein